MADRPHPASTPFRLSHHSRKERPATPPADPIRSQVPGLTAVEQSGVRAGGRTPAAFEQQLSSNPIKSARPPSNGKQMGTGIDKPRIPFDKPSSPQGGFSKAVEPVESSGIERRPSRTFDAIHLDPGKPSSGNLVPQLESAVPVSRHKPDMPVIVPGLDDTPNRSDPRSGERPARAGLQQRQITADPGSGKQPTRPQHPPGFTKSQRPITGINQVVQRPEQQHGVERGIRPAEAARIPHRSSNPTQGPSLRNMIGNNIDQVHGMPVGRKPLRVNPGTPTDVENPRTTRQEPPKQFPRPQVLKPPVRRPGQPAPLSRPAPVVRFEIHNPQDAAGDVRNV